MSADSSTSLQRNVAALRRNQPAFELPPEDGAVQQTDGVWRLDNGTGAPVAIHSREPQREADRTAAQLLSAGPPAVIVAIGLGVGYLADALERLGWAGRLLAIEPIADTVRPLLERREWHTWIEADRLRILVGPDYVGAADCWHWFGEASAEPVITAHPVLERVRRGEVSAARGVLEKILFDAASNAEARRTQGAQYLVNTLRNIPLIAAGADVSLLRGSARGAPTIIVAAGPSLDSSMPVLREVQQRSLIIAVDTALRPLLAGGVRPHAAVAVDSSEANGRHLTDLPSCEDTFLVAEGSIDPFAVSAFSGRTFFFSVSDHQPWPWLRSLDAGVGQLRAWGSVLTSAFDLALTMGADPIIFVGADLSYPADHPYCRGVSFEEDWRHAERWGTPLQEQWRRAIDQWGILVEPDVSGVPVRTAAHLVAFRNWLVEQMRRQAGVRFVNAGGAGILHGRAIEQLPPTELSTLFPPRGRGVVGVIRDRYQARQNARVRQGTADLLAHVERGDSASILDDWVGFAPGLTTDAILTALRAADRQFRGESSGRQSTSIVPAPVIIDTDAEYLRELAAAVPLVPLVIPPHRLERTESGARMFRFRSTSAAIMCCAMRAWKAGMAEDGVPLTRGYDMGEVAQGTYVGARDVVQFRATDGSDPRTNGRQYTILVPPPVIYLESLPLQDILTHNL